MSKKKVLIVSYYWPPAGGISVLRSLKIAKYLLQFGWEPIIYTVENAQYPIIDEDNLKHIPNGITVLRQKAIEPFDFYKKLTKKNKKDTLANVLNANDAKNGVLHQMSVWVRANFFIPDARALWVKPSVKFLTKYLKENPVDAIFSDGPPHTNTLIACRVSQVTSTPWLMDWQDPWTQVDYYKLFPISKWADKRHHQLEKECIHQASVITTVSPSWKVDLENIGGKNVHVIPWGYDEADYLDLPTQVKLDKSFTITHIGLLGEDRIPYNLIDVLQELCDENLQFKNDLKIELFGTVNFKMIDYINSKGLESNLSVKGQIPRKEALRKISTSQLLLLLLNKADNAKGRIPGKLFEYLYIKRPILTLGVGESDVQQILKETNSGEYYTYEAINSLKKSVIRRYQLFKDNDVVLQSTNMTHFDIKFLTEKISQLLNGIIK